MRARSVASALALWLGATPLAAAAADEDCTKGWYRFEPAFTDAIPTDGVLAFYNPGRGTSDTIWAEVWREDGDPSQLVAGALEFNTEWVVWRPDAPLDAGQRYAMRLHASNAWLLHTGPYCDLASELEVEVSFTALDAPRPQPDWDAITIRHRVEVSPSTRLDALVCCEGSYPERGPDEVWILDDRCTTTYATGELFFEHDLDPEAWGAALGQLAYLGFSPSSLQLEEGYYFEDDVGQPLPCTANGAIDLATGEHHQSPVTCPDPSLGPLIGTFSLDPRDALACEDLHYCTEYGGVPGWDPNTCRPWRGDAGCGCATAGSGQDTAGLLALLLVAAGRRQRRRRR